MTKTNILTVVTAFAAFTFLSLLIVLYAPRFSSANPYTATVIGVATSSSAISVTTSARLLSTTTSLDAVNSHQRVYTSICNASSSPVWLNLDSDKPANLSTGQVTVGIASAAGYNTCFEITDRNLYQGSITGSSSIQAPTIVTVKDYVY